MRYTIGIADFLIFFPKKRFLKMDKYLKISILYDIFCCIKADCLYMVTYINNEEENL